MVVKTAKRAAVDFGCGKQYKYDSGYYRHRKTCSWQPPDIQATHIISVTDDLSGKDKEIQS